MKRVNNVLLWVACVGALLSISSQAAEPVIQLSFDNPEDRMENTGSNPSFTFIAPSGSVYGTAPRPNGKNSDYYDASKAQTIWVLNGAPKLDARNFTFVAVTTAADTAWKDILNLTLDLDDDGDFSIAGNDRLLSFQRGSGGVSDVRAYYYYATNAHETGSISITDSAITSETTFFHLTFSVVDGTATLYLNGKKASVTYQIVPAEESAGATVHGLTLGRREFATNVNANNRVDFVQLFDTGLTQEEITLLYNQFYADATATLSEGTVDWNNLEWKDASGSVLSSVDGIENFRILAPSGTDTTLTFPAGWSQESALPELKNLMFDVAGSLTLENLASSIPAASATVTGNGILGLANPTLIPLLNLRDGGSVLRLVGGDPLEISIDTTVPSNRTLMIDKALTASAINWAGSRTLQITDNANLTVTGLFRTGASGSSTDRVNQTGGIVNANGDSNSQVGSGNQEYKRGPLLLGYWSGVNVTYAVSGGVLNIPNATARIGIDGTANLNVSGTGVANLHSIRINKGSFTIAEGGRVNIGKENNATPLTAGSGQVLTLSGGTLATWEAQAWTASTPMTLTAETTSTIDIKGAAVTFSAALSGTGSLIVTNSSETAGSLALTAAGSGIGDLILADNTKVRIAAGFTAAKLRARKGAALELTASEGTITTALQTASLEADEFITLTVNDTAFFNSGYNTKHPFLVVPGNQSRQVFKIKTEASQEWRVGIDSTGDAQTFYLIRKPGLSLILF